MDRQTVKNFIISNELFLLPLQSVKEGRCTCNNPACSSPGKHPLLKYSWKHVATNDPDKIAKWLGMENINYGVATGRKTSNGNRLFVIDIDAEDHPLLSLMPRETFHYRTGSGGWHFWFQTPYSVSNSASKIAPQVDVRGYGGYVVIPPSRHISGGVYTADFTNNIVIASKYILDLVFYKQKRTKEDRNIRKVQNLNLGTPINLNKNNSLQEWTKGSITQIRKWLADNKYIPNGARNIVLHRLLSSDRARGNNLADLKKFAAIYRSHCQDGDNISDRELNVLIGQVIKYPTYNTSYEKVNEAYFETMKRAKKPVAEDKQELIKDLDTKFFSNLQKAEQGMSLTMLIGERDKLMAQNLEHFSKYPQHLFAAKLKSLGFERYRTAKGNFWNCCIITG
jgi:hypothetical protein